EDGIRDRNVTGVQTCALPIYLWPTEALTAGEWVFDQIVNVVEGDLIDPGQNFEYARRFVLKKDHDGGLHRWTTRLDARHLFDDRSEERRVGKECRTRWWRDQQ